MSLHLRQGFPLALAGLKGVLLQNVVVVPPNGWVLGVERINDLDSERS